ncbi:MAG: glutaminase, partial [bacterium]|nr:glutaminase [bacterium]
MSTTETRKAERLEKHNILVERVNATPFDLEEVIEAAERYANTPIEPELANDVQARKYRQVLQEFAKTCGEFPAPAEPPSLEKVGVTSEKLAKIDELSQPPIGQIASYILALAGVVESDQWKKTAIIVGDCHGASVGTGEAVDVKVSAQSTIKPFLFLYALYKGHARRKIAGFEPTNLPFYNDPVMQLEKQAKTAEHPLNNAGGISSAGVMDCDENDILSPILGGDFQGFLNFMRMLTGDPVLNVDPDVFHSEMEDNPRNRAAGHLLSQRGRFDDISQGPIAVRNYTLACSILMSPRNLMHAGQVLASGGLTPNGRRVLPQNICVPVLAAMNSFGGYNKQAEMTQMEAGTRALTIKTGVAGLVINIDPFRGVYVTYGAHLDSAGNSVHGMIAGVLLNRMLASTGAMHFSLEKNDAELQEYLTEEGRRLATMYLTEATQAKKYAETYGDEAARKKFPASDPRLWRLHRLDLDEAMAEANRVLSTILGFLTHHRERVYG